MINLKVMSHNLGQFNNGIINPFGVPKEEVEEMKMRWLDKINEADCDFLGLQECYRFFDRDETLTTYNALYKHKYPYYERFDGGFGLALASKYPIKNAEVVQLTSVADNRFAMTGYTEVNGTLIYLISIHLTSGVTEDALLERNKQNSELIDIVSDKENFIIMGDFNAQSIDEYDVYTEIGCSIASGGWRGDFNTTSGMMSDKPYDNIVTSPNIKINTVAIGEKVNSDHDSIDISITSANINNLD